MPLTAEDIDALIPVRGSPRSTADLNAALQDLLARIEALEAGGGGSSIFNSLLLTEGGDSLLLTEGGDPLLLIEA